jgi:hypothetical protein
MGQISSSTNMQNPPFPMNLNKIIKHGPVLDQPKIQIIG